MGPAQKKTNLFRQNIVCINVGYLLTLLLVYIIHFR